MKVTILTLFPEMFDGPFRESILKHAQQKGLLEITLVNIRDFGEGRHKIVDDKPYGGGVGMVMKVDILDKAIQAVKDNSLDTTQQKVILLDARGKTFVQEKAKEFSGLKHLIILCGHYEGVDERIRDLVDETISLGDFILTGGEIPAMIIVDSVTRLIPSVLKDDATLKESFSIIHSTASQPHPDPARLVKQAASLTSFSPALKGEGNQGDVSLLEFPQYTTPREYNGKEVPNVLLSGNHKEIEKWRKEKSLEITQQHRPDLLKKN